MNGNGTQPDVDEHDDPDLLGAIELELQATREELRPIVERLDALEELRRRALAIASDNPVDRAPVTAEALRAAALAEGEESRARLELAFDRLT